MLRISGLRIYPVKSCGGIEVPEARVVLRGLEHDHRWMVVDENGGMVSQRETPKMALITTTIAHEELWLGVGEDVETCVPLHPEDNGTRRTVTVHGTPIEAMDTGDEPAARLSRFLERPVRLVWFPDTTHRFTKRDPSVECAFHDGYPLLVLSEESLAELNRRLAERDKPELPMNRFRPSIVVEGCDEPNQEDGWGDFTIDDPRGPVRVRGVKLCARCRITQTDQALGKLTGGEPMRTFTTYRLRKVDGEDVRLFGLYATPQSTGVIRVGAGVTVHAIGDISP